MPKTDVGFLESVICLYIAACSEALLSILVGDTVDLKRSDSVEDVGFESKRVIEELCHTYISIYGLLFYVFLKFPNKLQF